MKEIERKFLVDVKKLPALPSDFTTITQGYLHDDNPLVRIRTMQWRGIKWAVCTMKGQGLAQRDEIEFPIPFPMAEQSLELWAKSKIVKHRFNIDTQDPQDTNVWELDQFKLNLEGLWIAEIELKSLDENVIFPEWIGREVTNDSRYSNVRLAREGIPDETKSGCSVPPEGWYCTRNSGHEGPCAAWPTNT